jgi:LPXTG-site transpeptidase (sortase) family protein
MSSKRTNRQHPYKIPLLVKVVFLYALISVPVLAAAITSNTNHIAGTAETPAVPVAPAPQSEEEIIRGKPVRLHIPRLGVDLAVADGVYHEATQTWTLSGDSAHYAVMTPQPSNLPGNTLVYGHNTRRVLAATEDIRTGDSLVIKTDNGHTLTYVYTGDNLVNPSDTEFLSQTPGTPTLTLLTCDGPLFEKRRLMSFTLAEAQ